MSLKQHYIFNLWLLIKCYSLLSWADSLCSHVVLHEWLAFYSMFFWISTEVVYLQCRHGWCHMKLQPSQRKFCVHHTTIHHVTSCKATYVRCMRVLAVTCHLHFWQNDQDLLRATAATRGWNGYRNKSKHRKLTLEKKILLLHLQGFEPATFQSRVQHYNHWAIPAPLLINVCFCDMVIKVIIISVFTIMNLYAYKSMHAYVSILFFFFNFQLQCEFQSFKTHLITHLIGDWSQHNMVVQIGTVIIMTICLCLSTKERKALTFKILSNLIKLYKIYTGTLILSPLTLFLFCF